MTGILLTLFLCFRLGQCVQPTLDPVMAQYIGDHGDRITDLELLVQTLSTGFAYFQKELQRTTTENLQLKSRIQDLEDSCLNNTQACCTPCSSNSGNSLPSQTNAPTLNTTTSNHGNVTLQTKNTTSIYTMTNATASATFAQTTTSIATMATTSPQPGFSNCGAATNGGILPSGVFNITVGPSTFPAFCDGEWMTIQRRIDGAEDFNRNWQDYAQGFGDLGKEFWLGNEHISRITTTSEHVLRIDFSDWGGNARYAQYDHFRVLPAPYNYRLYVGAYSGDVGDSFHYPDSPLLSHHQMDFSTADRDNDRSDQNCAKLLNGGWWFNNCYSSNLNGLYLASAYGQRMMGETFGQPTTEGTGIEWYPYRRRQYSMRHVSMKIKPLSTSSAMIG